MDRANGKTAVAPWRRNCPAIIASVQPLKRMSSTSRQPVCGGGGTETERYLRIAMLRFLLLQTHDWSDEIAERLAGEVRSPSTASEKDTMTHQIIKELRD